MKNLLVIATLLTLTACSRGSGTYIGQPVDVGWEGIFMKSCEADFKTSDQASTLTKASSYSQRDCEELQNNLGKKYRIRWRHCAMCPGLDTTYEITAMEQVQ